MNDAMIIPVLILAMECIEDAARTAGPLGAPSGVVYAALSAHGMTLDAYYQILGAMQDAGKVKVEYDLITIGGTP